MKQAWLWWRRRRFNWVQVLVVVERLRNEPIKPDRDGLMWSHIQFVPKFLHQAAHSLSLSLLFFFCYRALPLLQDLLHLASVVHIIDSVSHFTNTNPHRCSVRGANVSLSGHDIAGIWKFLSYTQLCSKVYLPHWCCCRILAPTHPIPLNTHIDAHASILGHRDAIYV